jgi:hypothetical protein
MGRARGLVDLATVYDTGGALSFRNRIINGGFQVNQRGSVAATAGLQYGPDRWLGTLSGGTGISASFITSAFGGATTGMGAFLSGTWTNGLPYFAQRIESLNSVDLNGRQITVSGKFSQNTGSTQNIVVRISRPNALDNWTGATIVATSANIAIPSGVTTPFTAGFTLGASDATNGLMLEIYVANAISATNRLIGIADIQLEAGAVATPFERVEFGESLRRCQRYFEITSLYANGSGVGSSIASISSKVSKRASPTITGTNNSYTFNWTFVSFGNDDGTSYIDGTSTSGGYRIGFSNIRLSAEL